MKDRVKAERGWKGQSIEEKAEYNIATRSGNRGTGPQNIFLPTQIPFLPWSLNQPLHNNIVYNYIVYEIILYNQ